MKKLGKLTLKEMRDEMPVIGSDEQSGVVGGSGEKIDLGDSDQDVGMAILDALKVYNDNPSGYDTLSDIVDYSTGDFDNGEVMESGVFVYEGNTYEWSIRKPINENISGLDSESQSSGSDYAGFTTIENADEGNCITIKSTSTEEHATVNEYVFD